MSGAKGRVVVVATVESSASWSAAIRRAGFDSTAAPFARVASPADASIVAMAIASRRHDLVLATSANAVRFVPHDVGFGRAAAAVGPATAKALRERGFRVDHEGSAGAAELARTLVAAGATRRVLWLRGEHAREEGAEILRGAGVVVDEVESYRTEAVPDFAASIAAAGTPAAWVVGSPAAATALVGAGGLSVAAPVIAVGETTASALREAGAAHVTVAAAPTVDGIVATVRGALAPTRPE